MIKIVEKNLVVDTRCGKKGPFDMTQATAWEFEVTCPGCKLPSR
jgi:hypothetical protein